MRRLPQTVVLLGLVSLFTDVSSEMIYPLLPVFLATVLGAGPEALGIIEGVAEATASVLKLGSGIWSDRVRRRKPLVVSGYTLAGLVRPLIALAGSWPVVLGLRFADRVGKGLRTSPRDAMIADATPPEHRGEAFGVQRAMDHAGAVAGPLIAAALLKFAGLGLRPVFLLAAVPAAVVIVLVLTLKEPPRAMPAPGPSRSRWGIGTVDRSFALLLAAVLLFALGNSSDAFILLRLADAGVAPALLAVLWSAFHVVKMVSTYLGGRLSDSFGRRGMILAGWGSYAAVYLAFALVSGPVAVTITFFCYGIYFGLTEPVERAWVAELVPEAQRGSAFGLYHGVVGLGALPASVLFGITWKLWGAPAAFALGAALAAVASLLLLCIRPRSAGEVSS
jgi:MFS family permease